MSLGKGKVTRDREESCWRLKVQQRREKGGKKQRRENFICSKKGGKNRVQQRREKGEKNKEKTETRKFYML